MNEYELIELLKKASDLRDIEQKILGLSDEFELGIFINLYEEFYSGVKQIRNLFLNESSIPVNVENNDDNYDSLEYLQTILNNESFEELEKKKTSVIYTHIALNSEEISWEKAKEDFTNYFIQLFDKLEKSKKQEITTLSNISLFTPPDEDEKLALDEFYNWYGPYDYLHGMRTAGTLLIASEKLPENFSNVLYTIKQCYAFQQYLAVIVLCRTALEIALRELYVKLGFTKKHSDTNSIAYNYFRKIRVDKKRKYSNEYNPSPEDLRNLICKLPEYDEFDEDLRDLYGKLSRVIHGSTDNVRGKKQAEKFMKQTFWLIHDLFRVSQ